MVASLRRERDWLTHSVNIVAVGESDRMVMTFTDIRSRDNFLSHLAVTEITVLCHFRNIDLMPVIRCLTNLTFWSLYHVIFIQFCLKTHLGPKFLKK